MHFTFLLLTISILALWAAGDETAPAWRRNLWLTFLLMALLAALGEGVIPWNSGRAPRAVGALASLGLVAGSAWVFYRPARPPLATVGATLGILVGCTLLMLHLAPGFANPRVLDAVRFTPDAVPYSLYLNFDKTFAGIVLIGLGQSRITRARDWAAMLRAGLPWALGLFAVIMALSLAGGYVRFAPKFPPSAWLWMWVNLCFTCLAEEALFRGFIQRQLELAWRNVRGGPGWALALAALAFGLAHAAGGPMYVALATVAGLGYGWVYRRTGRIEASILTHFTLNSVHFFLFTYPAIGR